VRGLSLSVYESERPNVHRPSLLALGHREPRGLWRGSLLEAHGGHARDPESGFQRDECWSIEQWLVTCSAVQRDRADLAALRWALLERELVMYN